LALRRLGRLDEAAVAENQKKALMTELKQYPQFKVNIGGINIESEGAVLIELEFGTGSRNTNAMSDAEQLSKQILQKIKNYCTFYNSARTSLPERTTLSFYGPYAEDLFDSMKSILETTVICKGARITIRQGTAFRQVVMPSHPS
jgi:hypothetical protein